MEEETVGGMIRLHCRVQHYEWGRIGEESEVGRLHALMSGAPLESEMPYAELWMGTHPSGPSAVMLRGDHGAQIPLKDWLQRHPESLGHRVLERWSGDLPFLFKVLSVAKALSIQAHPDKKLAEALHGKHPEVYKDANHKPELALALTRFQALCGFVSSQELQETLESVPELRDALGASVVDSVLKSTCSQGAKDVLRRAFTRLMTLDESLVAKTLASLIGRLQRQSKESGLSPKEELVLRLEKQYPGDVGVLSAFFLNYTTLEPGQAVFLDANEPHAYVSGECVECMATSDNVVRAGLTPKFRDTQTLCSMLSYNQGPPQILDGCSVNPFTRRYSPPSDEFEVDHICVPVGESVKISAACGPSIYLVYRGVGVLSKVGEGGEESNNNMIAGLVRGNIFLLVEGTELELSAVMEAEGGEKVPLQIYRAGVSSALAE